MFLGLTAVALRLLVLFCWCPMSLRTGGVFCMSRVLRLHVVLCWGVLRLGCCMGFFCSRRLLDVLLLLLLMVAVLTVHRADCCWACRMRVLLFLSGRLLLHFIV
jgi:hypothetical protein